MAGTFGYELNLGKLSEEEKEEIRSQVEEYRKFAPLIQTGLYYRLSDPSKEEYAAWAFVSEDQKEVLLNVVMQEIHGNMTVNYVNLQGLKCSAVYRDTETGKTYNGAALMEAGIPMPVEMGEFKGVPDASGGRRIIQEPVNAGEAADKQFLLHFLQENST